MDKRINSYRFDLISEVTDIDPETRKINITVKPDPRRYRRVKRDDGEYLEDTLDRASFPKTLVFEMLREALSRPALNQPQTIGMLLSTMRRENQ